MTVAYSATSKTAQIGIIGGGIVGCAIAYNLAKLGAKDIVLFEKKFLASGSTGRCGGGIRQQWSTPDNCKLAHESVKLFQKLPELLDYPQCPYEQGGYLILAYTEKEVEQFKKNVQMQQSLGLPVKIVYPDDIHEITPPLNTEGVLLGTWCPTDGSADPFLVTQGYAEAARRLKVQIKTFTSVNKIEKSTSKGFILHTDRERWQVDILVNAGGGYSQLVAAMLRIELPIKSYRHEILVTEPIEHIFDPMLISFQHPIYFRQHRHGGFIGGHGDPHEPSSFNTASSWQFCQQFCTNLLKLIPSIDSVKVVRQWAGLYNVTPDAQPILGGVDGVPGYYQAVGFSGHGFMLAPMTAKLIAQLILTGKTDLPIERLHLNRFKDSTLGSHEASVV